MKQNSRANNSGWHFASLPGRIAIWIILAAAWLGWAGAVWKLWQFGRVVLR